MVQTITRGSATAGSSSSSGGSSSSSSGSNSSSHSNDSNIANNKFDRASRSNNHISQSLIVSKKPWHLIAREERLSGAKGTTRNEPSQSVISADNDTLIARSVEQQLTSGQRDASDGNNILLLQQSHLLYQGTPQHVSDEVLPTAVTIVEATASSAPTAIITTSQSDLTISQTQLQQSFSSNKSYTQSVDVQNDQREAEENDADDGDQDDDDEDDEQDDRDEDDEDEGYGGNNDFHSLPQERLRESLSPSSTNLVQQSRSQQTYRALQKSSFFKRGTPEPFDSLSQAFKMTQAASSRAAAATTIIARSHDRVATNKSCAAAAAAAAAATQQELSRAAPLPAVASAALNTIANCELISQKVKQALNVAQLYIYVVLFWRRDYALDECAQPYHLTKLKQYLHDIFRDALGYSKTIFHALFDKAAVHQEQDTLKQQTLFTISLNLLLADDEKILIQQEYIYRQESIVFFSKSRAFQFPSLQSLHLANKTLWIWRRSTAESTGGGTNGGCLNNNLTSRIEGHNAQLQDSATMPLQFSGAQRNQQGLNRCSCNGVCAQLDNRDLRNELVVMRQQLSEQSQLLRELTLLVQKMQPVDQQWHLVQ